MKILALVPEAYRGLGGIAQYNRDLLKALALSSDVEVIRVLPRLAVAPIEQEPVPDKVSQASPIFTRPLYALKALREAIAIRPKLIFCGHLYTAPLAQFISKVTNCPFVVQLHGTEIWKKPSASQVFAIEQASVVICVSRHTRSEVLRFTCADPNSVIVIPNTVGQVYRDGERYNIRKLLGFNDEFVMLTVGRLDSRDGYKGHDKIIDLMNKLPKEDRQTIYLISGDGDDRPRLQAMVSNRGLADRVHFLGFTQGQDLPDLYRAADLFVMPSTGEGFGIVFLEAMASGTPALGLAVGGATDPLDFEWWGRAVAADQLANAIAEAKKLPRPDPTVMHEAVNARFGFEVFAKQVETQIIKRFSEIQRT